MNFAGMTINERLFVSGLIKEFDSAVKEKNRVRVVEILKRIDLNNQTILGILEEYNISE